MKLINHIKQHRARLDLTQEDLALALGAADYLRKPINRADLLAGLR